MIDAPDQPARQAICRDMQLPCLEEVPFCPLGQFGIATAYRGLAGALNVRPD